MDRSMNQEIKEEEIKKRARADE
ncbi:uncharacterized protein G2W53_018929 [Senna tora]|uniref:Uncharacterized protein n=1 Tax=Senna tora TaxID=362788 RepID=A0A834WLJ5_9FABA|nr:uncharacterized protein G2W53_018929 [Senna tora]